MHCERCGEREATIHEVVIQNGQKLEHHICEQCASSAGIDQNPSAPINELITNYILGKTTGAPLGEGSEETDGEPEVGPRPSKADSQPMKCPGCGTTYREFRKSGLLGCQTCYDAFGDKLAPLLERAHEGGSFHVGKLPRRALEDARQDGDTNERDPFGRLGDQGERLKALRDQLAEAVAGEHYERAAIIRDAISQLGDDLGDEFDDNLGKNAGDLPPGGPVS